MIMNTLEKNACTATLTRFLSLIVFRPPQLLYAPTPARRYLSGHGLYNRIQKSLPTLYVKEILAMFRVAWI